MEENILSNKMNYFEDYYPEKWMVHKDDVYAAIHSLQNGLEYARECLMIHEKALGRTTLKNKRLAEMMEQDIEKMEIIIEKLRKYPI